MSKDIHLRQKISGRFKFQVIENGHVVEDRPWSDNMILNRFLDGICDSPYPNIFQFIRYHKIGTGSAAVAATDTSLQNGTKTTSTRVGGSGNLGSSWAGSVFTVRQTFDHAEETVNQNYTEHGLSDDSTASGGGLVRTRALISGGTLTVLAGQQARCIYDISVTVSPTTATPASVGGTGWPVTPATTTDGDYILGYKIGLMGEMDTGGGVANGSLLLGVSLQTTVQPGTAVTLPAFGGVISSYGGVGPDIQYQRDSYTVGTYTFTIRPNAYATPASFSSTSINGWVATNALYSTLVFRYDQNQTKANTHKLRYPSITVTWSR